MQLWMTALPLTTSGTSFWRIHQKSTPTEKSRVGSSTKPTDHWSDVTGCRSRLLERVTDNGVAQYSGLNSASQPPATWASYQGSLNAPAETERVGGKIIAMIVGA